VWTLYVKLGCGSAEDTERVLHCDDTPRR
jgi:hypothetical protein